MLEKFDEFSKKLGCVLLDLDLKNWNQQCSWIVPEDVYMPDEKGISKDPHVTVMFGVYSFVNPKMIENIVKEFDEFKIFFTMANVFKNEKFDVLTVEVESKELEALNNRMRSLPHNEGDFHEYKPHLTIAYLNPGTGQQYADFINTNGFEIPESFNVKTVTYSNPNKIKTYYTLNGRR